MAKVYIITGEASGDILASRLMTALGERLPDVDFAGVGGETMASQGFRSLFPMSELSVMGFWEVVPRLPKILRRVRQTVDDIDGWQPDVVVTVDSWGFVGEVLKRLKKRGSKIPVVHYVAPQVWAWKKGRAKKTAQLVDRLMTLWPYEPPLFERHGLRSDFVGHPVIENVVKAPEQQRSFLCILPGSRHSEVKRLAPMFGRVAARLQDDFPGLEVVIPTVEGVKEEVAKAFPDAQVIMGQQERYEAFRRCRFAIAASGTVSLELTACGVPHIIAYRFSWLTDRMVKMLVRTPFANMINILAGREIIPEFVLENCREELIYEAAHELMRDGAVAREQVQQASEQLAKLKPEGMMPSQKAAEVVVSVIDN
jgi:lipid-A-disaccharide synthase